MLLFRLGLFSLLFLFATSADAREGRQAQFPHGDTIRCDACHTQPNRGITDFGFDSFAATMDNGIIDWSELAAMDSDKDGYSNGLELGDPNGTWRRGDAQPGGDFWNPGDKDDNPCGNDNLDPGEDCDGGVDNTVTCASLGMGIGTVRCSDLCKYETTFCVVCGDGKIDPNVEQCEGTDFAGETCENLGFKEGTLACDSECKLDDSGCSGVSDDCGDGIIQTPEDCDGDQLLGKTCAIVGFDGGVLGCSPACRFDTSACFGGADPGTNNANNSTNNNSGGSTSGPEPKTNPMNSNEIVGEGSCTTVGNSNSFLFGILILGFFGIRRTRI